MYDPSKIQAISTQNLTMNIAHSMYDGSGNDTCMVQAYSMHDRMIQFWTSSCNLIVIFFHTLLSNARTSVKDERRLELVFGLVQ